MLRSFRIVYKEKYTHCLSVSTETTQELQQLKIEVRRQKKT